MNNEITIRNLKLNSNNNLEVRVYEGNAFMRTVEFLNGMDLQKP